MILIPTSESNSYGPFLDFQLFTLTRVRERAPSCKALWLDMPFYYVIL